MKLKNKQTGEIGLVHCDATMFSNKIGVFIDNNHIDLRNPYKIYDSLAELNADWEDVPEEPKVGYIIDPMEEDCVSADDSGYEESDVKRAKELGIWLETEEEAEKAVEKLKAWQRLKDKGFRFYRWNKGSLLKSLPNTIEFACDDTEMWTWGDIQDDLDLLFGGEE